MSELFRTPLHDLHRRLGAKLVPFAGYEMPVQYPTGVMKEHIHTREAAGLFDVSHMGQVIVRAPSGDFAEAAAALETLAPVDLLSLAEGRQRYALFTNDDGGIIDDLMAANRGDHVLLVVNAACKANDLAHMKANLDGVEATELTDRGLLALQGPAAEAVLERHVPGVAAMRFMDSTSFDWSGVEIWVSRSGYTGEDGFEISIPADHTEAFAEALLAEEDVWPIGLGARDSLRLESGLCLYGNDMDESVNPIEAGLQWAIQKARRPGGARAGGFPGEKPIFAALADGPPRRRRGLLPEGRAPMREGVEIYAATEGGAPIGRVTSGGFGPSVERPIAMGYLPPDIEEGATVYGEVRGRRLPVSVAPLPFRTSTYKR